VRPARAPGPAVQLAAARSAAPPAMAPQVWAPDCLLAMRYTGSRAVGLSVLQVVSSELFVHCTGSDVQCMDPTFSAAADIHAQVVTQCVSGLVRLPESTIVAMLSIRSTR
jgi:hypothetical protein